MLADNQLEYSNPKGNYIDFITKDGEKLGEFTNGKNSGWMYTLNSVSYTHLIAKGKVASDSNNALTASISSNWNKVTNKDGSIDWYLISMGINNRAKTSFATKTNDNNYSDLEYDDEGNIIHGVWSGHSWMWLEGGKMCIRDSLNAVSFSKKWDERVALY